MLEREHAARTLRKRSAQATTDRRSIVAGAGAIRPGERVFFEPDEDHWHGAAPTAS
jgi:hypothetical protein